MGFRDRIDPEMCAAVMGGGAKWEASGAACPAIVPTVGADLWDAPASSWDGAGIYAWTPAGSNTVINDTNTGKITYVDNSNGATVNLNNAADLSADLTYGVEYQLTVDFKAGAATAFSPFVYDGIGYPEFGQYGNLAFSTLSLLLRAFHATGCWLRIASMAVGEIAYMNNQHLYPVTGTKTLLGTRSQQGGTYICNPTVAIRSAAGLIVAYLDDSNYLWMVVNRALGCAELFKLSGGTWTKVISSAIVYAAGGELKLVIDPATNNCSLYYAGVQVGITTAVAQLATMGTAVYGYNNLAGNTVGSVTTSPF